MKLNLRFFLIPIVVALVTAALSLVVNIVLSPLMLASVGNGGAGSMVILGVLLVISYWIAGKIEIEVVFAIAKKEKDKSIYI